MTSAIKLVTDAAPVHYGFPRVVRAGNSDLLLFYRVGTSHAYDDAAIAMRRSADDGQSWSDQTILRSREEGFSAHNPVALVATDARVILWSSRYEYGPSLRHPCWWSTSADDGHNWAAWTVFDESDQHSCYYVTDAIHTAHELLACDATFPASGEGPCHTRIHASADDGASWTCRSALTAPGENLGDEAALMETAPDRILCVQRDRARADVFRTWSSDGGRTWSDRQSICQMLDCVLQRPFLTRMADDSYLLSGRDYTRKQVVAYLSTDGGDTFGQRLVLDTYQKDGGYTTAIPLNSGECLLLWYSDSHTDPLQPDIKEVRIRT